MADLPQLFYPAITWTLSKGPMRKRSGPQNDRYPPKSKSRNGFICLGAILTNHDQHNNRERGHHRAKLQLHGSHAVVIVGAPSEAEARLDEQGTSAATSLRVALPSM